MSFFTPPPLRLPELSEFRDPREFIVMFAYVCFFVLCNVFIIVAPQYPEIDLTLDEHIYHVIDHYSNHRYWYLCVWNFGIEMIFAFVCVVDSGLFNADYDLHWRKRIHLLRYYMFHGLVVPISSVLGIYFWALCLIPETRKVILPDELNEVIPLWIFIALHSACFFPFLIEHNIYIPRKKIYERTALFLFYSVYGFHIVLLLYFHFTTNQWLYPILRHMHFLFQGFLLLAGCLMGYFTLGFSVLLHNHRCREEPLQSGTFI